MSISSISVYWLNYGYTVLDAASSYLAKFVIRNNQNHVQRQIIHGVRCNNHKIYIFTYFQYIFHEFIILRTWKKKLVKILVDIIQTMVHVIDRVHFTACLIFLSSPILGIDSLRLSCLQFGDTAPMPLPCNQ